MSRIAAEARACWEAGLAVWPLFDREHPDSPAKIPQCLGAGVVRAVTEAAARPSLRWTVDRFAEFPDANLGLHPGPLSGVVAVDVDPRNDPDPTMVAALAASTPCRVRTGRGTGGQHFYFAWDATLDEFAPLYASRHVTKIPASGRRVGPDGRVQPAIELPWNMVLPPSRHPSPERGDGLYAYEGPTLVESVRAGTLPPLRLDFVLEALAVALRQRESRNESSRAPGWFRATLRESVAEGARADTLKSIVARLARAGLGEDDCLALALLWAEARVPDRRDFDDAKVAAHVAGVHRYCVHQQVIEAERERLAAEAESVEAESVEVADEWPAEVPEWTPPRAGFPTDSAFRSAPAVAKLVSDGARSLNVPEAYIGMTLLSCASAMIQGRASVLVCNGGTEDSSPWGREPAPLWSCTLGPPSSGKTRAFEKFVLPFVGPVDDERVARFGERQRQARVQLMRARRQIKRLAADDDSDDQELGRLLDREVELIADGRAKPRMLHESGTIEGLRDHIVGTARAAVALGEPEIGRVAWISDEGKGLFVTASGGSHSKGVVDVSTILRGHTGSHMNVHMVKGDYFVPQAFLTCCILPQPKVLRGLRKSRSGFMDAGFEEGGLLSRFMYAWPARRPRNRSPFVRQVDESVVRAVGSKLKVLARATLPRYVLPPDPWRELHTLSLELEDRVMGGDLVDLPSWADRGTGHAVRLALALHVLSPEWDQPRLSAVTVRTAADLVRGYFASQATDAWALFGEDGVAATAQKIWTRFGCCESFDRDQVTCGLRGYLRIPKRLATEALELGENLGFWRMVAVPTGGRDRRTYVVNPRARARALRGRLTADK